MKRALIYLCFFGICFLAFACKSESKSETTDPQTETLVPAEVPQAPEIVADQLNIAEFIERDWKISHKSDNGQMQNEDAEIGSILSFDAEGNFSWKGNGINNEGRWTYDEDETKLLLESSKPELTSEWTVKYKRSVMVWIGSPKFGHNSIQMMLNQVRAQVEK